MEIYELYNLPYIGDKLQKGAFLRDVDWAMHGKNIWAYWFMGNSKVGSIRRARVQASTMTTSTAMHRV